MEVTIQNINLNNLDKSSWELFKFEEIAQKISKTVKPENAEVEIYVGLEHLDANDIHIRRKGVPSDVKGGKLRCYPGDVIFGKRRAYQRKAAIVDFHGICSAHAFVFRANPELIDPKLFPFFLHSDQFMHRMVDISVGGLSPTINWGDLKHQEFLLPPKDQQAQLAELLWAMDEVVEKGFENKNKYETFYKRYLFDSVSGKLSNKFHTWQEHLFGDLGESFSGLNGKTKKDFGKGSPFVNYMNVFSNSKIDPSKVDYVKINDGEKQNELKYGDILITGSSETPQELGMSSIVLDDLQGYYLNSFCFGFRLNDFKTLLPEYARFLMRGEEVRKFMFKRAQGSTRFNLSKTTVKKKMKIILPKIDEQKQIADKLEIMEDNISSFESKITSSKALQKSLINQVF
ncbi:restriction endonuclease subunit S [Tenacibaculum sp. XPcli2-G]|uniref:restriction endonuclease subunit S n=1 Tax=Tenacibaculum sp. XPcli2-G TaxID=2954503 RepID=UPI002097F009|nr:restriction endonuclease subunit S [Tenacibaculum sp. XPcli2-G]MCO7185003.1 restriction endonuclease subunit S [Tenacibaculum sp. XPcli2-G]